MSGPDLVEPAFHFCVGYALRLVLPRRIEAARRAGATGYVAPRWAVLRALLETRVVGLIVVSIFFTEGWAQFDSWSDIGGFRDWLTQVMQTVRPYHTLLHIALITIWAFPALASERWQVRAAMLVFTFALHCVLLCSFYFRWIHDYGLDEGGYFAFVGWSVEALTGALAHDLIAAALRAEQQEAGSGAGRGELAAPLLDAAQPKSSLNSAAGGSGGSGGGSGGGGARRRRGLRRLGLERAALQLVAGGAAIMLVAYLLSCLGAHPSPALNPVCYNGTRIYFWGGFGDEVPCAGVPTLDGGILVRPPFAVPDEASNVVTAWTMTQRAGSATYHLFTAGTSAVILAALIAASELGCAAPRWWRRGGAAARAASAVLGVRTVEVEAEAGKDGDEGEEGASVLLFHSHVFEVFGENALAIYIAGDQVGNSVGAMIPADAPPWYFLCFGEVSYIGVLFVVASYLRAHKLFLRL